MKRYIAFVKTKKKSTRRYGMYVIKNALRNISRSKGRNILILIILLVIVISSCVALSIRHAAETAREEGLAKLNITAQITPDISSTLWDSETMR